MPGRTSPMIATALLVAVLPTLPLSASPASAGGPTCRGQQATHVGAPGTELVTTPGPDVVVTNGSELVRTLNGDDVICATGARWVYIVSGGGDDVVDATGFTGRRLQTSLGEYGVDGSSGNDLYLGGDQADVVSVSSGSADDRKEIHTDGGKDYLNVDHRYPGDVAAELGKAADRYKNYRPRPGVVVDGEEGHDHFLSNCRGCRVVRVDLGTGAIVRDQVASGSAADFEDLTAFNRHVQRYSVAGNRAPNKISVTACSGSLRGRNGADRLSLRTFRPRACDHIWAVVKGGDGDDSMVGSDGDDTLRGGPGQDEAHGGAGSDLCRAEVQQDCER